MPSPDSENGSAVCNHGTPQYKKALSRSIQDKALFQLYYQDSNLDKQDQNLLCYHYTIEQCNFKTKHPKEVVLPGFEPGQTGPESVVLPLHHRTMSYVVLTTTFSFAVQRYAFLRNCQIKIDFFFIFSSTKEILYLHSNCN